MLIFALHTLFIMIVHTPLITAADCEGAGEQFTVTTILPEKGKLTDIPVDKAGMIDYSKVLFSFF